MTLFSSSQKQLVLLTALCGSFLTPYLGSSVTVSLAALGTEFSLSAVALNWVNTLYLLSACVALVPMGRLADGLGQRKVFLSGVGVLTLASLGAAISPNPIWLFVWRAVQGVGSGAMFATGIAMVTVVFAPGERGKAIGITVAAVYVGLSVGPFLGGILTEHFGWRAVYMSLVPAALATFLLGYFALPTVPKKSMDAFDRVGALLQAVALILLMIGMSRVPSLPGFALVFAGALALVGFIRWELKAKQPLLPMALFANNRAFALSNLAALINYSATFAVTFLLALYLQNVKGLSPQRAGLILVIQPVIMAICSPISGRLSDKVEPRGVASLGMALTALGLGTFALLTAHTSLAFVATGLVMLGIGFGLFSSPNTNAIMSSVPETELGVASAVVGTMRLTGQMLSMGITAMIFTLFLKQAPIGPANIPQFMNGLTVAFALFSGFCFFGVWTSWSRGKMR